MRRNSNNPICVKDIGKGLVLLIFLMAVPALGDYEIVWSTIDGGGGASSSGQYVLTGTIGQADAAYSEGGPYELLGGFWPGGPLCIVDFEEFALFAEHWLESGPDLPADLDGDNDVDMDDLEVLVYDWLWYCPYGWSLR